MIGYRVVRCWRSKSGKQIYSGLVYPWPGHWKRPRPGVVHETKLDPDRYELCSKGVNFWRAKRSALRHLEGHTGPKGQTLEVWLVYANDRDVCSPIGTTDRNAWWSDRKARASKVMYLEKLAERKA